MYRITKEFSFEAAHMLEGHNGLCLNLHGHSYRLLVSVSALECVDGMVVDFACLKEIVWGSIISKIDHAFCFNALSNDEAEKEIASALKKYSRRVYELDCRPTAENMCKHFFAVLNKALCGKSYSLDRVALYETPTSFCEYTE